LAPVRARDSTGADLRQRVDGPNATERGLRFDPNKHLLDPYGRGVVVPKSYSRHAAQSPGFSTATAMKSVVVDRASELINLAMMTEINGSRHLRATCVGVSEPTQAP
jgi:pullulanase/glycogen debranching enzyme